MKKNNGAQVIADYIHQELVRRQGLQYGILGNDERQRLFQAGVEFNKRFPIKLMAHGVDSTGFQIVSNIFLNGGLRHYRYQENYGELGVGYTGMVGHWDFGKGLFVVTEDELLDCRYKSSGSKYNIPLEKIEAAVFPTEVAEVVKYTFPSRAGKIKGYAQLADELETLNTIFDIDQRRKS